VTEDLIILEAMHFFGYHGTLAAERDLGQRFVVDVELRCDLRAAGETDNLDKTVDYSQVYHRVRQIVEGPPVLLTETVAERIAAAVLADHLIVESVRVRVCKPQVRLEGGVLGGSAVEITRHRQSK
jgi:dihydroneopterin aldolase